MNQSQALPKFAKRVSPVCLLLGPCFYYLGFNIFSCVLICFYCGLALPRLPLFFYFEALLFLLVSYISILAAHVDMHGASGKKVSGTLGRGTLGRDEDLLHGARPLLLETGQNTHSWVKKEVGS